MDGLPNPGHDADMLRRAAEASRNVSDADWFSWVSSYLDGLADRLDPRDPDERGMPFVKVR